MRLFKHVLLTLLLFSGAACRGQFDARREIIDFMENSGMRKYLHAPVVVNGSPAGVVSIVDTGIFAIQHDLLTPEASADPNVVLDETLVIAPNADKLVVVTHGWLDKGEKDWPNRMAAAIARHVDPNEWICASYDWKGGSVVFTSVQAARYARDIAGPRLAAAVSKLDRPFDHIHLIGHSAGSWTIHSAAQRLAERYPDTTFHLTFLDAYVPEKWETDTLGDVFNGSAGQYLQYWADHYYTRDITYKVTQYDLKWAHNVDISDLDPLIVEHEFPYRWYMATITGHYERWDEKNEPVYVESEDTVYGFLRSRQAGAFNWQQSRRLEMNNQAVCLQKQDERPDRRSLF